jgi:hypothetical protein
LLAVCGSVDKPNRIRGNADSIRIKLPTHVHFVVESLTALDAVMDVSARRLKPQSGDFINLAFSVLADAADNLAGFAPVAVGRRYLRVLPSGRQPYCGLTAIEGDASVR